MTFAIAVLPLTFTFTNTHPPLSPYENLLGEFAAARRQDLVLSIGVRSRLLPAAVVALGPAQQPSPLHSNQVARVGHSHRPVPHRHGCLCLDDVRQRGFSRANAAAQPSNARSLPDLFILFSCCLANHSSRPSEINFSPPDGKHEHRTERETNRNTITAARRRTCRTERRMSLSSPGARTRESTISLFIRKLSLHRSTPCSRQVCRRHPWQTTSNGERARQTSKMVHCTEK